MYIIIDDDCMMVM